MQLQYFDHYRLLCVRDDASCQEIESAYRKAVAETPRDWRRRLIAQLAGKTSRRFTAAYEELIDPAQRAKYDVYLARVNNAPLLLIP